MPALRTRDTQSRPLEVSTDAPQPPTFAIISPTPRAFTFPQSHSLDSPYSTPSSSPFEPDVHSLALSSLPSCTTPPLTRNLSPDSVSSASPAPSTPKRRKSSTGPASSTSPDAERRPKKGDENYIKRPENAFILFRRKCCEDRQPDFDSASDSTSPSAPTKKQRQADLSKTISQQWKSLSTEERQYWEHMAKEKKKEHEALYPNYVYRPQRVKDKDGKVRNRKRQPKNHVSTHQSRSPTSATTESGDFHFVIPQSRQHGRSISVPTPPPMQSIRIPQMPHIIAPSPSCPSSPSLSTVVSPTSSEVPPMISRRATEGYDYGHLVPPVFTQGFEHFQSSDDVRSMFNLPTSDPSATSETISPSSTTVPSSNLGGGATPLALPHQIHTHGLLPSPNIISPASASSGCSSGPVSPSNYFTLPQFQQPQIQEQSYSATEYSSGFPPEYTQYPIDQHQQHHHQSLDFSKFPSNYMFQPYAGQVEYSDYAEVPDFQQPEGYDYAWGSDGTFPSSSSSSSSSSFAQESDFELGSIPACEVGVVQTPMPEELSVNPLDSSSSAQSQQQQHHHHQPHSIVARSLEGVEGGLEVELEQGMSGMGVMEIDMEGNAIMSMGMGMDMGMGMSFDDMGMMSSSGNGPNQSAFH